MPDLTANGVRLYYERSGEGDPLLLISGLGGGAGMWQAMLPRFAKDFHCILYDHRGTGRSDAPPGPYTMDQMADDAAALLTEIGLAPADCVGLSMGGCVLQALAYRHPEVVRKAVLLSTFGWYTEIQHAWLDVGLTLRRAGADPMVVTVAGMPWTYTGRVMSLHEKAYAWASLAQGNPYPTSLEGYEAHAHATRNFDSRGYLGEIQAPTLVLVGAEDILTPVHQAAELAARIPSARLMVLPRGSHAMIAEYQDDVVRAIRDFLREGA